MKPQNKSNGFMRAAVFSAICLVGFSSSGSAETYRVKIGSGHSPSWHFVSMTQSFFIPEVIKRVKAKTGHDIEFVENWSGSAVKTTEVLEAVEQGVLAFFVFATKPKN